MANHYSLSDSDMLGIYEAIDKAENGNDIILYGIKAIWNAILAQEGMTWESFTAENSLNSGDYAIPTDQMTEIGERLKTHAMQLGISDIGITNIMMDVIVNYGPSTYK